MRRAKWVIFTLNAPGKTRQAAALPQRADAAAPASKDFMRIGLMADIPDQPVLWRVEGVMQRHRQLDHAKPGAKMPAGDRHSVDGLDAQFVGELPQVLRRQGAEIGR